MIWSATSILSDVSAFCAIPDFLLRLPNPNEVYNEKTNWIILVIVLQHNIVVYYMDTEKRFHTYRSRSKLFLVFLFLFLSAIVLVLLTTHWRYAHDRLPSLWPWTHLPFRTSLEARKKYWPHQMLLKTTNRSEVSYSLLKG